MTWLHPWGLLGLLAVPVLVALSLWRRQRREAVASSLLLWRQVADLRRTARAAEQRRRIDPLLVVRVAAALVLAAALCGPLWLRTRRAARRVVLVVDRSASMATRRADGASRWAAARRALLGLLGSLSPGDHVHVILAPPLGAPPVPSELTPAAAEGLLNALAPSHASLRPDALVAAARSAAATWPDARLVVATDDPPPDLPEAAILVATGGPADNRGIVALAARARPDGRHEILVRLANAAATQAETNVTLLAGSQPVGERDLLVPPQGTAQAIFEADLGDAATLEARLDAADALAVDDRAWLARRREPLRIALIGDTSFALRRVLAAQENAELAELADPPDSGVPAGCDLAVYYHAVPTSLVRGPVVVVAPRAPVGQLRPQDATEPAALSAIERGDPLVADVELDGVSLGPVHQVDVPQGFKAIARAGPTPLIGRWSEGAATVVYVGIDPARSNWPLRPSFPIFWANVVASLAPASARARFACARPGDLLRLGPPGQSARVLGPRGQAHEAPGGVFRAEQVGRHTAQPPSGPSRPFAVSLLAEAETLAAGATALPATMPLGTAGEAATAALALRLSVPLAVAAALLILLHGWLTWRAAGT